MKIFFLCKRCYTNKDVLDDGFGRLFHLPVGLQKLGAMVYVHAIDYRKRDGDARTNKGVSFRSHPAKGTRLFGAPLRLIDAVKQVAPDVVIASGDSHIGFFGQKLAVRANARFVYDVYDFYPAFAGNRIPGMKSMFWSATGSADLVLCASASLQRMVSSIAPRNLLVENGVDRGEFYPQAMESARAMLKLDVAGPVVGYFGSITPARGPLLINACQVLRQRLPSLRLLLAGRVTGVDIDLPWIVYRGELPQDRIRDHINCCDVVTIPYADNDFNRMSGPCKVAEYLACKKPVVATRVPDLERIFSDADASICDPDAASLAKAIQLQLDHPEIVPFPETMDWGYISRTLWESLRLLNANPNGGL